MKKVILLSGISAFVGMLTLSSCVITEAQSASGASSDPCVPLNSPLYQLPSGLNRSDPQVADMLQRIQAAEAAIGEVNGYRQQLCDLKTRELKESLAAGEIRRRFVRTENSTASAIPATMTQVDLSIAINGAAQSWDKEAKFYQGTYFAAEGNGAKGCKGGPCPGYLAAQVEKAVSAVDASVTPQTSQGTSPLSNENFLNHYELATALTDRAALLSEQRASFYQAQTQLIKEVHEPAFQKIFKHQTNLDSGPSANISIAKPLEKFDLKNPQFAGLRFQICDGAGAMCATEKGGQPLVKSLEKVAQPFQQNLEIGRERELEALQKSRQYRSSYQSQIEGYKEITGKYPAGATNTGGPGQSGMSATEQALLANQMMSGQLGTKPGETPKGPTGDTGSPDAPGADGPSGVSGPSGFTGPSGLSGPTGLTGLEGFEDVEGDESPETASGEETPVEINPELEVTGGGSSLGAEGGTGGTENPPYTGTTPEAVATGNAKEKPGTGNFIPTALSNFFGGGSGADEATKAMQARNFKKPVSPVLIKNPEIKNHAQGELPEGSSGGKEGAVGMSPGFLPRDLASAPASSAAVSSRSPLDGFAFTSESRQGRTGSLCNPLESSSPLLIPCVQKYYDNGLKQCGAKSC